MKKLYLISNDKIWSSKKNYTSNNDLNNIISCLNKKYQIELLCRKSKKKLDFLVSEKFNIGKINEIKEKEINVLMISISPFNFLTLVKLFFLEKKIKGYVYLRSDGFLEYKIRYGILGYYIYFLMFYFIKAKLKILSCSYHFTHVKINKIIHPSELTESWFKKKIKKKKTQNRLFICGEI